MDSLSKVDIFLEVVKQNSFSAAARCLNMSAPAVSKQVQGLEKQLGVKLLNRTTRFVTLTEEGVLYAGKAKRAMDDLHEAERQILDLKTCPTGLLRVNAPFSFGTQYLAEPIADFAKSYPDVVMDVNFDDRYVDVIAEGYDVVVRIGALQDSSLVARKLADCPILLCASPDYLAKQTPIKLPQDLQEHKGIVYSKHDNRAEWQYFDSNGKVNKVQLNRNFIANNAEAMLEACRQGLGLAVLPIFTAATYLNSGQLVNVLPDYKTSPELAIYALYPQNRYLSTKVRLFIDWLVSTCKALPW